MLVTIRVIAKTMGKTGITRDSLCFMLDEGDGNSSRPLISLTAATPKLDSMYFPSFEYAIKSPRLSR
jgi:hypothetical protein